MSFSSCIPLYLLLRNVSQLPSALRTFPDFRQAFVKYHSQFIEIAVLMHEFLLMHSFTISRFPHSLTACKLVSSLVYFVSFKRFLLSVCSSSNWEVKLLLCKKKETSRSRLIASYLLAWQRPTLAERKSDYHRR